MDVQTIFLTGSLNYTNIYCLHWYLFYQNNSLFTYTKPWTLIISLGFEVQKRDKEALSVHWGFWHPNPVWPWVTSSENEMNPWIISQENSDREKWDSFCTDTWNLSDRSRITTMVYLPVVLDVTWPWQKCTMVNIVEDLWTLPRHINMFPPCLTC